MEPPKEKKLSWWGQDYFLNKESAIKLRPIIKIIKKIIGKKTIPKIPPPGGGLAKNERNQLPVRIDKTIKIPPTINLISFSMLSLVINLSNIYIYLG